MGSMIITVTTDSMPYMVIVKVEEGCINTRRTNATSSVFGVSLIREDASCEG